MDAGADVGAPPARAQPEPTPAREPWPPPPTRLGLRSPRIIGYGVVAILTVALVVTFALGPGSWEPSTSSLPPNQAGYLWCCGATDVGATWNVPRLVPAVTQSAEGVWIGLQTESGKFFLQVGTQDNEVDDTSQYEAFWSSGPLHGAPVNLGQVNPGDSVRARLSQSSGGWVITFADRTQHWTRTHVVQYPTSAAHAFAEWIEEDPAEVIPFERARLFQMARTGGTGLRNLEVNGAAPVAFDTQPETFVDGSGTKFSPTPIDHNSFHFLPW